jgi:hypothetical protein
VPALRPCQTLVLCAGLLTLVATACQASRQALHILRTPNPTAPRRVHPLTGRDHSAAAAAACPARKGHAPARHRRGRGRAAAGRRGLGGAGWGLAWPMATTMSRMPLIQNAVSAAPRRPAVITPPSRGARRRKERRPAGFALARRTRSSSSSALSPRGGGSWSGRSGSGSRGWVCLGRSRQGMAARRPW